MSAVPTTDLLHSALRQMSAEGVRSFHTGKPSGPVAANEARTVHFTVQGEGCPAPLLSHAQAMQRWAADGDVRAWLKTVQPGGEKRLDSLRTLRCHSEEAAQDMRAARAYYSRPGPAPVYPAPSCSEREEWARGVRQEGVL
jgi:hypothetical protein